MKNLFAILSLFFVIPLTASAQFSVPLNFDTTSGNVTNLTGTTVLNFPAGKLTIGGVAPATSIALTTTGTSGAATLVSGTLNIPQYSGGGSSYAAGTGLTLTGTSFSVNYGLTGTTALAGNTAFQVPLTLTTTGTGAATLTGTGGLNIPTPSVGGSGTVTSVALTAPSIFTVTGSPVTTSGTLAVAYSGTALPIANGGTGQTTAGAGLSAAWAGAPTGTGSFVLATSPALVTPALGTPSSGTLTSCTSLPISTGVSGINATVLTALPGSPTGTGSIVLATSPTVSNITETGTTTVAALTVTGSATVGGQSIGRYSNMVVETTSSGTWTVPGGITTAKVTVIGGGGAGDVGNAGGGGGSGAVAVVYLTGLTGSCTYTVGSGGASAQAAGGNSTLSFGGTTYTGGGGAGGFGGVAGAGGTATNGMLNLPGGPGGAGQIDTAAIVFGGNGGNTPLGYGQGGCLNPSNATTKGGQPGTGKGAGGAGGAGTSSGTAGSGTIGAVIIEY